uniref:Uncharacterized protein n=1 Tax=viral metagenome TaxID=1070528 RepID=A0A6M3KIC7_9ZZZZ
MYEGQLGMDGATAGLGAPIQILDVAGEACEDAYQPIYLVTGVVNHRTLYDATYKGQKCTYTVTAATMAADDNRKDAATVQVAVIQPFHTILRAPIYDGAFGTNLTECTEETGSSSVAYTDTTNTVTSDIADDWGTVWPRTGANKGLPRIMTTHTTSVCTTTLAWPFNNAAGDKFVRAAAKLGHARLYFGGTANYVDGDQALSNFYNAFVTKLDLSRAGHEYVEFMVANFVHAHASDLRLKTDVVYL